VNQALSFPRHIPLSFTGRCKKHFQLRFIVACIGLGGVAASLALHFSAHYFTEQFRFGTLPGGLVHFKRDLSLSFHS